MHNHHIYHKNKVKQRDGKYPKWIDCPINMIILDPLEHLNEVHAPSNNVKGMKRRQIVYLQCLDQLKENIENGEWELTPEEYILITNMYFWCLCQCMDKRKKDVGLIDQYCDILKKYGN